MSGCEEALTTLEQYGAIDRIAWINFEGGPPTGKGPAEDQEVSEISVDGDTATAKVGDSPEEVELRRVDGEWRVARLGRVSESETP